MYTHIYIYTYLSLRSHFGSSGTPPPPPLHGRRLPRAAMAAEGEGTPPTDVADVACSQEKDAVGEVFVTVMAEDELDRVFEWTRSLPRGGPLSDLARHWAVAHSVTDSAVGFDFVDPETGERREIDLGRSPSELGWPSQVRLFAFPR